MGSDLEHHLICHNLLLILFTDLQFPLLQEMCDDFPVSVMLLSLIFRIPSETSNKTTKILIHIFLFSKFPVSLNSPSLWMASPSWKPDSEATDLRITLDPFLLLISYLQLNSVSICHPNYHHLAEWPLISLFWSVALRSYATFSVSSFTVLPWSPKYSFLKM